jgi:hypothetical protein
MGINLSARIAKRELAKNKLAVSKNKVAFLALSKDIKEAIADGWSLKNIWETLHEEKKIQFSYKTFRGYVAQFITTTPLLENLGIPDLQEQEETPGEITKSEPVPPIPKFTFNPVSNLEELV